MSEFSWWLLVVGLVVGAGLVWLLLGDSSRREADLLEAELPSEAAWIAATMTEAGQPIDAAIAEEILRLHRAYLAAPPPDEPDPGAPAPHAIEPDAPADARPDAEAERDREPAESQR